jgi:hypothetical protein
MRTGSCGCALWIAGESALQTSVTSRHVVAPGLARESQGRKDGSVKERAAAGGLPPLLIAGTIFSPHVVGFTISRDCIEVAHVRDRGQQLLLG